MSKQKLTAYLAIARAEGFCEGENCTKQQEIEAWQYIIDHDLCRGLQGWFGRMAENLIERGICQPKSSARPATQKKTKMLRTNRLTKLINKAGSSCLIINKPKQNPGGHRYPSGG